MFQEFVDTLETVLAPILDHGLRIGFRNPLGHRHQHARWRGVDVDRGRHGQGRHKRNELFECFLSHALDHSKLTGTPHERVPRPIRLLIIQILIVLGTVRQENVQIGVDPVHYAVGQSGIQFLGFE